MNEELRHKSAARLAEHLRVHGAVLEGPSLRFIEIIGVRRVVADDRHPYRVVVPAGGQAEHGSFAAVARIAGPDGDQALRMELPDEVVGLEVEKRRPVMLHLAELAREEPDRYPGLLPVSAAFAATLPGDGWDSDLRGRRVICDVAPGVEQQRNGQWR